MNMFALETGLVRMVYTNVLNCSHHQMNFLDCFVTLKNPPDRVY